MSRIIAIDYGKKRTGIAVSDTLQMIANGLTTVPTHELLAFIMDYVDERFTSVLAHRTMLEAGLKKKDRRNKALVDEISATIILQTYLENRRFSSL